MYCRATQADHPIFAISTGGSYFATIKSIDELGSACHIRFHDTYTTKKHRACLVRLRLHWITAMQFHSYKSKQMYLAVSDVRKLAIIDSKLLEILAYISLEEYLQIQMFPDGNGTVIQTSPDDDSERETTVEHFLEFDEKQLVLAIGIVHKHHQQNIQNIQLCIDYIFKRQINRLRLPRTVEDLACIAHSPTDAYLAVFLSMSILIIGEIDKTCDNFYSGSCIGIAVYTPCGTSLIFQWENKIGMISLKSASTLFEFARVDSMYCLASMSFYNIENIEED